MMSHDKEGQLVCEYVSRCNNKPFTSIDPRLIRVPITRLSR